MPLQTDSVLYSTRKHHLAFAFDKCREDIELRPRRSDLDGSRLESRQFKIPPRNILQCEHDLKKWRVILIALRPELFDQLLEGHVLVLVRLQSGFPYLCQ